jgi:hypothetical protein
MTHTPPIETTTEDMMDNPPVRDNDGLFSANHGNNQKPPAIDTFDTAYLSGNGFDAIWQYNSLTELLLRRVRHKHTKGRWINYGFQQCLPNWLEGKLVHDGAYTRYIFVNTEDLTLVSTPLPFAFPDVGGCIAEGSLLTPQQSKIDLSRDGDESFSNPGHMVQIQKENKQDDPKISDDEVPGALLSLFQQPIDPALPDYLSSNEYSKNNEAPSPSKLVIPDFTGNNLSLKKGAASEKKLVINPPPADKPPSELDFRVTLEYIWSSKDPGIQEMLKSFLATKGFTPVATLDPRQLFAVSSLSKMAKTPVGTPKSQDFIAKVPSPFDSTPRNVYRFDGAASIALWPDSHALLMKRKHLKLLRKNDQQNYIRDCIESQHHLLRSKTMNFARKNMVIVN